MAKAKQKNHKILLVRKTQQLKDYVVFDIETTGLSPKSAPYFNYNCGVIEMAAVKYVNGIEVERFDEMVDPLVQIPAMIVELTGITQGMVTGKRTIGPVIEDFKRFTEGFVIVAHNASFEKRFMDYFYNLCGYVFENEMVDTLAIARIFNSGLKSKKLGDLCLHYGIELQGAHRAINDVLATGQLFQKLQEAALAIDLEDVEIEEDISTTEVPLEIDIEDLVIEKPHKWEKKIGSKELKRTYFPTNKGTVYFDHVLRMWHYKNFAPSNEKDDLPSRENIIPIISKIKQKLREKKQA